MVRLFYIAATSGKRFNINRKLPKTYTTFVGLKCVIPLMNYFYVYVCKKHYGATLPIMENGHCMSLLYVLLRHVFFTFLFNYFDGCTFGLVFRGLDYLICV